MFLNTSKTALFLGWFVSISQLVLLVALPMGIHTGTIRLKVLVATVMLVSVANLGQWLKAVEERFRGSSST